MLKKESRHLMKVEESKTGRSKPKADGSGVILGNNLPETRVVTWKQSKWSIVDSSLLEEELHKVARIWVASSG
jgi:hypothetical protein